MITFLLQNLPVLIFAALIVNLYFNIFDTIDGILCIGLFYFSYIVITEQLLGLFNILTLDNLLLINLLILIIVFFFIRIKNPTIDLINSIQEGINNVSLNRIHLFLAAIILGFSLVKLTINLVNPPFGWDSLNYHFTFAVEWLKHRSLDTPLVIADNPCPSYYPLNGSLIYLWLILPFKNVFLADLGQMPFFFLAFAGTVYAVP
jgi:hypothetical protein